MLGRQQALGAAATARIQLPANQRQRVRAQGGAHRCIVAVHILGHARHRQAHVFFGLARKPGEQWQLRLHRRHFPARQMPVPGQALQGAGIGEQLAGTGIEVGALAEVEHITETTLAARPFDAPGIVLAKAPDHAQPQANRHLLALARLQRAIPIAVAHIHRAALDTVAARILEDLVRAVEAHRPAVDQGAGIGSRLVALEPATGIGQQGKTGGMGLGKTIAAEALDLLEDARGELGAVATREHALGQALLVRLQPAVAFPRGHGPA
ncbi:hypothetical protein D9M71_262420 [compost metagenome]